MISENSFQNSQCFISTYTEFRIMRTLTQSREKDMIGNYAMLSLTFFFVSGYWILAEITYVLITNTGHFSDSQTKVRLMRDFEIMPK